MNVFVWQDWFPFLLAALISAIVIVILAKFLPKAVLYAITTFASLLCLVILLASVWAVGGWKGMGLGLFTVAAYIGVIVGTIISIIVKKR